MFWNQSTSWNYMPNTQYNYIINSSGIHIIIYSSSYRQNVNNACIKTISWFISRYIDIFLFLIINAEVIYAKYVRRYGNIPVICTMVYVQSSYIETCLPLMMRRATRQFRIFFQCLNTSRKIARSSWEVQQGAKKPNPQT